MMSVRQHGNPHWTSLMLIRRRDSKLLPSIILHSTEARQNYDNSSTDQCKTERFQESAISQEETPNAYVEHFSYTSMQDLRVHSVHLQEMPLDLQLVIKAWEELSGETKLQISDDST
jgi:hypothetical protein